MNLFQTAKFISLMCTLTSAVQVKTDKRVNICASSGTLLFDIKLDVAAKYQYNYNNFASVTLLAYNNANGISSDRFKAGVQLAPHNKVYVRDFPGYTQLNSPLGWAAASSSWLHVNLTLTTSGTHHIAVTDATDTSLQFAGTFARANFFAGNLDAIEMRDDVYGIFSVCQERIARGITGRLVSKHCNGEAPTSCEDVSNPFVSAHGDPHCVNVQGEKFDVRTTGKLSLVTVPRGSARSTSDLMVEAIAEVNSPEMRCAPTFIRTVDISGKHVGLPLQVGLGSETPEVLSPSEDMMDKRTVNNGVRYTSGNATLWVAKTNSHNLQIKIGNHYTLYIKQRSWKGYNYLDIDIKGLRAAGVEVGGLLGSDSHDKEAALPANCGTSNLALTADEGMSTLLSSLSAE